jgi:multidrug efflux system outer membrane protein
VKFLQKAQTAVYFPVNRRVAPALRLVQRTLLATILGACSPFPAHEQPALPVSVRFPGHLDAAETRSAEIAWRSFFVDPRLRVLIDAALEGNRDLRMAVCRLEQSREQAAIVRARWMPAFNASATMERARLSGKTAEQWMTNAGLAAYEVDLFGRIRSLHAQAQAQVLAADEARNTVQISLVAEVATQYFAWLQALAQVDVARKTLQSARDLYALTKAILEAGATHELDARTAEGQVKTVHASLLEYQLHERETQNLLALLTGGALPCGPPPDPLGGVRRLLAPVPPGLPSELVLRRADILQAEHLVRAARAHIGVARAAFFPSIRLTGTLGTMAPELGKLFAGGGTVWRFAPDVTVPLFAGGQNLANYRAAKVGVRFEVARYEKTVQTAFREVADALAGIETAGQLMAVQNEAVAIQERRLDLATARYRAGEDAHVNVLLAQQALYAARQAHISARFRWLVNQVSLYRALGGGWR